MIRLMTSALDRFRGSGDAAVTIPSMDGAFRPNNKLDKATMVLQIAAPDNLAYDGTRILFSSGPALLELTTEKAANPKTVQTFEQSVSALDVHPSGVVAIGLASGEIALLGGNTAGRRIKSVEGRALRCPTALRFIDATTLLVCLGSQQNNPSEWARDLLEGNSSGSVWRIDLDNGKATCLLDGLAWPAGVVITPDGRTVVAEAWRHRLIEATTNRPRPLLTEVPGYPGRIVSAKDGSYWISIFAPRSQLVEFILRERPYRERMMRELDSEFWVAPSLHSSRDYREPLLAGAIRRLGVVKPWAPSLSYGLVARLNQSFGGVESFHSRADGTRHGITSCVEIGDRLFVTSKGGDEIMSLDLAPATGVAK